MLSLVSLLVSVSAKSCCNFSSSTSSNDRHESSSLFDCARRSDSSDSCFNDCTNIRLDDENVINSIIYLKPFLSHCARIDPKNCLPMIQYFNSANFYTNIPDAKKLQPLFTTCATADLLKLARKLHCFKDFDAYFTYFYNVDGYCAASKFEFSNNFISFFLARYLYFLDLFLAGSKVAPCGFRGNCLYDEVTKKQVDFLNLPPKYTNITFGSPATALANFNAIVTDTTSTKVLCQFIACLISQIEACYAQSIKGLKVAPFNTFTTYVIALKGILTKVCQLAECNLKTKVKFVSEVKTFCFVEVPLQVKAKKNRHSESSCRESRSSSSSKSESESYCCVDSPRSAIFIEIFDFIGSSKLKGLPHGSRPQDLAVYTKPNIARFF